jgi:natural product precursor
MNGQGVSSVFKNSQKKLSLNKETVRALSGKEMQGIMGGRMGDHGATCTCNCKTLVCDPK